MLMGASATRGACTFTPGAAVRPVNANSSTSGGYSPEVRFICSARASSTMLTTKSRVYSIFRTVSFLLPSRRPEENAKVGGSLDMPDVPGILQYRAVTGELANPRHVQDRLLGPGPWVLIFLAHGVLCVNIGR